jgi:DNA-binding CsgD family transcriptional regulator
MRGHLAVLQSDPANARPALERAATVAREAGRRRSLVHALAMASVAENMAGEGAAARRLLAEARTVNDGIDDVACTLTVLQAAALDGLFTGDREAVTLAAGESMRVSRKANDLYALGMMQLNLGTAALLDGDLDGAKPMFLEALRIAVQIDDRVGLFYLLDGLGCHAAGCGQARLATQLLGAGETLRLEAGARVMAFFTQPLARAEEAAIAALGRARFDAERQAGRRLSRQAAIALALGEPAEAVVADSDGVAASPLGKRQADVARLVADGLSNKQIGARLFISERTVDSHVRGILNKLGFNSRTEIARWVAASKR